MSDWKTIGIQIAATIISSSLILSGLGFIYSEIYNKPRIEIKIIANDIDRKIALIKVANNGRVPATNFVLKMETPENITKYSIFSTENSTTSTLSTTTPKLLEVHVPKFIHGEGSIVRLFVHINATSTTNLDYAGYATYDQGSAKAVTLKPLTFEELINNFMDVWLYPLVVIGLGMNAAFLIFIYIPYVKGRLKRYLNKYMTIIDSTYDTSHLYKIRAEIMELLRRGKISESHYKVLDNKISEYIENLKSKDLHDDTSPPAGVL